MLQVSPRVAEVSREELEAALERLQASAAFERSFGLLRLLRFLLRTAENDREKLRETYIGTAFFNRNASYDPRADSIVRVNMTRLRHRLDGFYANDGVVEPVRISIPVGSYLPMVTRAPGAGAEATVAGALRTKQLEDQGQSAAMAVSELPAEALAALLEVDGTKEAPRRQPVQWLGVPLAMACVLLLCLVVAAILRGRRPAEPTAEVGSMQEMPLTVGRDLEFEPATSADGRRLAYVSRMPGSRQFQIFLRSFAPDSRDEKVLQTGLEHALYPAWSPDGRQIAFLRCGHAPCDIATVSVEGGPVRSVRVLPTYALPDDQGYYQYRQLNPIWTADGKALIYPYRGEQDTAERLVMQDLASNRQTQLTFGEEADEDAAPALAPDGSAVAFLRRHLSHTDVMTIDLVTRRSRVLETEPNGSTSGLTWAPDGRGVVIGSARRARYVLLYIPLHRTVQGEPKPLDVKRPMPMNPMQANDGRTLMFLALNRSRDLAEVSGASGQPTPVFPSKQRNTYTAFSPDTQHLAFLSDRSGTLEVWLSQRRGATFFLPVQLTHGLGWYPSSITWAPDGHTLAVGISNSNEMDVVSVATGAIDHLRLPGLENCAVWSPVWSSDGQWIYMSAWGERNGIFRASTSLVPAVEQVWAGRAREVRLDGDRALYFEPNYGRGIFKILLRGPAEVAAVPQLQGILPARAWLVQNGRLLYIDVDDPVARLHALDLTTGTKTELTGPLPRVAFADGTLSYADRDRLLVYSEWAEAAGSQIIGLRWR